MKIIQQLVMTAGYVLHPESSSEKDKYILFMKGTPLHRHLLLLGLLKTIFWVGVSVLVPITLCACL